MTPPQKKAPLGPSLASLCPPQGPPCHSPVREIRMREPARGARRRGFCAAPPPPLPPPSRGPPPQIAQGPVNGKFSIIGVEGANFFNSTKRGKERGRGGRGGERGGRGRRGRGGNIADVLCVDILACNYKWRPVRGRARATRTYTRTERADTDASMSMPVERTTPCFYLLHIYAFMDSCWPCPSSML